MPTIRLFTEPEKQRARYPGQPRLLQEGRDRRHLRAPAPREEELTTRELAERVMCERELDVADVTLRNSVVFKVVQALRHAKRRRLVRMVEKRKGMCVWAPATPSRCGRCQ